VRPAALLEDVAGAILDGTPVDWSSIESRAEQTDQPLVEQLKTLAALWRSLERPNRRNAPRRSIGDICAY
jgi:hypothetical protein